jgi:hypothetical protein
MDSKTLSAVNDLDQKAFSIVIDFDEISSLKIAAKIESTTLVKKIDLHKQIQ